jgi:hypothetical protein
MPRPLTSDREARETAIIRRQAYHSVFYQLRIAHVMLTCAEEAGPGPGRILSLWCAGRSLENAHRLATYSKVGLFKRIAHLQRRRAALVRHAGEGEAIGPAFGGEVHIISRDASGQWSERRERVH